MANNAHTVPRLIFEPYQEPVIDAGYWPTKRQIISDAMRKKIKTVIKTIGSFFAVIYLLAVIHQIIIGPTPEPQNEKQKTDLEKAIEWVMS